MKAVSTIFFTAGPVEVEPAGPQYAGVQGDHQATRVVFILDEALYAAQYSYRLEYVDGMGGYDTTDYLKPVAQEGQAGVQVEYWLPDTWTRSGGAGEIRLVVALLDSLNNEQQIVHTLTGRVYFSRREAGSHEVQSHLRHGLSSLIADAQKSAAQAQLKAEMASEAGERAQAAAIRAETAADSVNEVLSNATEAIDGAYAAGEAASKAAGQAERAADYAERAGVAANAAGAFAQNEAQNAGAATVLASQAASQASEAARSANSAAVVAENAADAANQAAGSITNKVSKDDITQLIPLHTMERSDDPIDSWKVSPELNIPNSGPVIGMTIRAVLAEEWDASVPMWCWGDLVPLEPAGIYPAGTYLLSLIYSGGRRSWRIQGADKADKTDVAPALTGTASGTALHLTDAAAGTRLRSLRFTGKLTETVEGEKGPDNPSTLTGVKPAAVQAGDSAFPLPLTAPLYSLPFVPAYKFEDSFDAASGVLTRRLGVKTFTGKENDVYYYNNEQANSETKKSFYYVLPDGLRGKIEGRCTHFRWRNEAPPICEPGEYGSAKGGPMVMYFTLSTETIGAAAGDTPSQLESKVKAWLAAQAAAGTPVMLVYVLAEPVTEQLPGTAVLLPASECTITAGGAAMTAEYVRDTNAVMEKMVAPALTGTASGTALHLTDAAAGTRLRSLQFIGKLTETVEGEKGPDNPSTLTGVKPAAVQAGDSAFLLPLKTPLYNLPFVPAYKFEDSFDAASGVLTRRLGVKTFTGKENDVYYYNNEQANSETKKSFYYVLPDGLRGKIEGRCTHFRWRNEAPPICEPGEYGSAKGGPMVMYFTLSTETIGAAAGDTPSQLESKVKAWLAAQAAAGTPVMLVYVLAEPVTEQLPGTAVLLPASECTITAGGAAMTAEYVRDTNAVIAGLAARVAALEGGGGA